ncbi:DNA-binding response regulator [Dulcicalothrix desertica PCC 7102]|uniref:DNA-binding response regulator n=1 Tax=Dulcicalothrix desertica PCC 7102 TaxID=232991 RepID=A0A433VW25_9CYAN|nr:response regulator transcription factor [Dulcicalothrix desertica]RUT10268.1 DNA-binding response regulator [Dulcicalothrix desertica PCC 7102]TWH40757.1 LuxR family two component transcriptional regulator [Dulcicalothrix desertica PCC 7102]
MIRLLLVDDQSLVRQGLKAMLSIEPDLEIIGMAENGEEAVSLFETLQPDVVLMDVRMPVMNGSTATRQICEKFPNAKVLVLSTYDEDRDVSDAIRAGAKGYLLKDMPSDELVNAIRCINSGYAQLAPGLLERVINPKLTNTTETNNKELSKLTPRELDVAKLVAIGATNQEIATKLFISECTVKTHINSIFNRLNLKNRAQLAIYANGAFANT